VIDPFGAAQSLEYNVELNDGEPELTKQLLNALKKLYERSKTRSTEVLQKELFEVSYNSLSSAISQGFGKPNYGKADLNFVWELHKSARFFVARKTALQVIQLNGLIADTERGTRRPFSKFKKLSKGIIGNYNQTWLKTEYDTAISAARSARDWIGYEENADLYPNIEYLRTVSAEPDKDHLKYVGIIRPINDPFWDTHLPPSRWNCKCSVKNTAAPVTVIPDNIDDLDPVVPAFQNNPGKTKLLFNLPYTSYALNTTNIPDAVIAKELKTRILPELENFIPAYSFDNGGELLIHPGISEDEFMFNTAIGTLLASKGKKVKLLQRFAEAISPDALVGNMLTDFKGIVSANVRSAVNNTLRSAAKQGVKVVVLYFKNPVELSEVYRNIKGKIVNKGVVNTKGFEKFIVIDHEKNVYEKTANEIIGF
jgi:hypothetical protein